MDICREVRDRLDLTTAAPNPAGADAAHLRECSGCRDVVTRRQHFDTAIGAALVDVPVPAGLEARLLTLVAQDDGSLLSGVFPDAPEATAGSLAAGPDVTSAPVRDRGIIRRWGWGVALSACVAVAVFAWLPSPAPVTMDFATVQTQLQQQLGRSTPPEATIAVERDQWETQVVELDLAQLRVTEPQGIDLDGEAGADALVYAFRRPQGSGVVVAIPTKRLTGTLPGTTPRHMSQQRSFAWSARDGQWTYVCLVHSGSPNSIMRSLFGGLA